MQVAILYHNDNDGKCAAAIAKTFITKRNALNEITLLPTNYDKPVPYDEMDPCEEVWVIDFSLKPEQMKPLIDAGKIIVWIDHHKTAAEYDYGVEIKGLRNFVDKAKSGCELTWEYCFPDQEMPAVVATIGKYDKWAYVDGDPCEYFHAGSSMYHMGPQNDSLWVDLLYNNKSAALEEIVSLGKIVSKHNKILYEGMSRGGYEAMWEGHKCYFVEKANSSKVFGKRINEYDLCVGYGFNGKDWIVSLYSLKHDCGEICKKFGGGGHKGAAGFVSKEYPFPKRG